MNDLEKQLLDLLISRGFKAVMSALCTACAEMGKRDRAMGYRSQGAWLNTGINLNAKGVLNNPEAER